MALSLSKWQMVYMVSGKVPMNVFMKSTIQLIALVLRRLCCAQKRFLFLLLQLWPPFAIPDGV